MSFPRCPRCRGQMFYDEVVLNSGRYTLLSCIMCGHEDNFRPVGLGFSQDESWRQTLPLAPKQSLNPNRPSLKRS